jgi:hypothetical protein
MAVDQGALSKERRVGGEIRTGTAPLARAAPMKRFRLSRNVVSGFV